MDTFDFSPFGSSSPFPKRGVLPKTETGALSFVSSNPEYDGRGVIVAILDTGCDPGSDGLSVTSEGKPKFIDVIDSTGSGDVNTSKQIKISSLNNGILTSPLSNNKLELNQEWIKENKNGYFNIGLVRAYDFFPKPLIKRLEKKRTQKFGNKLTKCTESLRNELNNKRKTLQNAPKDISLDDKKGLKDEIDDLNTLIDALSASTNTGSGPVFDLIVWNNGKQYNAVLNTISMDHYVNCIDLDEVVNYEAKSYQIDDDDDNEIVFVKKDGDGDFVYDISRLKVLTNYKINQEYDTISPETMLNYVMNIYDKGNLVSIVVPGGSHGTHVAGIVAGYYKDEPSLNGIAPGAQLVSIKIGDTRLSTMETNQGLMRSLYHIKQHKCDLVNMSYGEPTTAVKTGCFPKGVEALVWKYGTIFISSAGNDGPCLSTAGAPQSCTDAIIGIGAMFSPQMIESEYGLVQKGDDGQRMANYYEAYSWSSRGPTMDGAIGVKIMSPGGAIAPIPSYTLSKNQLMNGTSMSSPNACGNVALLLSGLKQENIEYTPYGIELALINSAKYSILNKIDVTARGYGLLQIRGAYEYCSKHQDVINSAITHFDININGRNHSNCRGIYIREALQSATSYNVSVTPKFHEDTDNNIKVKYQIKCQLKTDENWITPAPFTLIAANGRYFEIRVDPLKLYHSNEYIPVFRGYVVGIDTDNIEAGPLFRIPVTVCNHITYPLHRGISDKDNNGYLYSRKDSFSVGKISRVFHLVPRGASAARFKLKCVSSVDNKSLRFCFASLYGRGQEQIKFNRWFRVKTGDEISMSLQRVEANTIIETSLCQYALSFGECMVSWSVEFIGPSHICSDNVLGMNTGDEYGLITLRTDDIGCNGSDEVNPLVKFDTFVAYYVAQYATIDSCVSRLDDVDINDSDSVYSLNLEYEFDQKIAGTKNVIKFSLFDDLLYESLYLGNFWMLFDSNKQLISCGEAFEESSKIAKQKGYVLILQLRSASIKLLEKAKNSTVLRIETVLTTKQQINCDIYSSKLGVLSGSSKVSSAITMNKYNNYDLYVSLPTNSNITKSLDLKNTETGNQLLGFCKLNKELKEELRPKFRENGQKGSSSLCIPLCLTISTANTKDIKSRNDTEIKEEKEEPQTIEEKQRDAICEWIQKKLKNDEKQQMDAFKYIDAKYTNHLTILSLKLDILAKLDNTKEIINTANQILNQLNPNEIAAFFGKKIADKNDEKYKKNNKKYKEEKAAIIDALKAKLNAIKKDLSSKKKHKKKEDFIQDFIQIKKDDLKEFEDIYKELSQWIDIEKDKKLFELNLWYNLQKGFIGKVVNIINDKINDEKTAPPTKEQIEIKLKVYKRFLTNKYYDTNFLVKQIQYDLFKKFPKHHRLF